MNRTSSESKVVSLFEARKNLAEKASTQATETPVPEEELQADEESFESVMRKNNANKERMRQERLKANKSVLRSYRIKQH